MGFTSTCPLFPPRCTQLTESKVVHSDEEVRQGDSCLLKPRSLHSLLIFPSRYPRTTAFVPASILSVQLISLEAGNQITLNYKVIKGHLKSSLSKRGLRSASQGFCCTKQATKRCNPRMRPSGLISSTPVPSTCKTRASTKGRRAFWLGTK